ncbi:hypothetical protein GW17_00042599 [Ensete ventricosum]|nr:hypothetical protein GW17_00042599 [Ensete ventricosum]RZS24109.1 hypothetical protein BHM03_00057141 [Ensete ventricosum]
MRVIFYHGVGSQVLWIPSLLPLCPYAVWNGFMLVRSWTSMNPVPEVLNLVQPQK